MIATKEIDWSKTTWKGSRKEQHELYLLLPFRRKMEITEELCDMGRVSLERLKRQGLPYIDPYTDRAVPAQRDGNFDL